VKPRRFQVNSADSFLVARHFRWRHWGDATATGGGLSRWCDYDRSQGCSKWEHLAVRVSHIVQGDGCLPGRRIYRRLGLRFGRGQWFDQPFGGCG
jgi:hypothetical protein